MRPPRLRERHNRPRRDQRAERRPRRLHRLNRDDRAFRPGQARDVAPEFGPRDPADRRSGGRHHRDGEADHQVRGAGREPARHPLLSRESAVVGRDWAARSGVDRHPDRCAGDAGRPRHAAWLRSSRGGLWQGFRAAVRIWPVAGRGATRGRTRGDCGGARGGPPRDAAWHRRPHQRRLRRFSSPWRSGWASRSRRAGTRRT